MATPEEEQALATVQRWLELIHEGPDYPDQICAADYRAKSYPEGPELNGIEELRAGAAQVFRTTPNRKFTADWMAVQGDKVVIQGTYDAVYEAAEEGMPPVGTEVHANLCVVLQVRDGRIVSDDTGPQRRPGRADGLLCPHAQIHWGVDACCKGEE